MKIFTVGCGRWGSFIAWYLDSIGHEVTLYGREGSNNMLRLLNTRRSGPLEMPHTVELTTKLDGVLSSDVIIVSIPSQSLDSLMRTLSSFSIKNKTFVLCMKGLEIDTGRRLSEISRAYLDESNSVAVWLGPGHVEEFMKGNPNCMVIDSENENTKAWLISEFSSPLIRFYYGADLVGNEIGAATKNVIGIAAGILDGLGLGALKGALMARAPREISRLIEAAGGSPTSAYGLCHLGDYEATVFSEYSHNRAYGESLVTGVVTSGLAEGVYTVRAVMGLAEGYGIDLPICRAVYDVAILGKPARDTLLSLFERSLKREF